MTEEGKKVTVFYGTSRENLNWNGYTTCSSLSLCFSVAHFVCYSSCQWGVHRVRKRGAVGDSDLPNAAVWVGTAAWASQGTWKGSHITLATNTLCLLFKLYFSLFLYFLFPFLPLFSLFCLLASLLSLFSSLKHLAGCRGEVEHKLV